MRFATVGAYSGSQIFNVRAMAHYGTMAAVPVIFLVVPWRKQQEFASHKIMMRETAAFT
ncbi:MAG: hypothetical protein M1318_05380 [Firmicutes bacterium]|nr:hypothetical protein [Bacillota bacterium]